MKALKCSQCGAPLTNSYESKCKYCSTLHTVFEDLFSTQNPDNIQTASAPQIYGLCSRYFLKVPRYCDIKSLYPKYDLYSSSFFGLEFDYDYGRYAVPATLADYMNTAYMEAYHEYLKKRNKYRQKRETFFGKLFGDMFYPYPYEPEQKKYPIPPYYPNHLLVKKEGKIWRDVFYGYTISNGIEKIKTDFYYSNSPDHVTADKLKKAFSKCDFEKTSECLKNYLVYCDSEMQRAHSQYLSDKAELEQTIEKMMKEMR